MWRNRLFALGNAYPKGDNILQKQTLFVNCERTQYGI